MTSQSPSSPASPASMTPLSTVFPMLVAISVDAAATAALHVTHALARECGAVPTVLRVVHREIALEAAGTGAMAGVAEGALDPAYRVAERTAFERQIQDVLGELPPWRYEIEAGATVTTIVHRARALDADLVLLGLPQHNFFRRAFVADTVRGVIEQTKAAVFAIRPGLILRPSSVLVAVDFGTSSLRAAHLACQLVAPGGRIILAYVQPDEPRGGRFDAAHAQTEDTSMVDRAFTVLINELTSRKGLTITSVIEHGNAIESVKEVARRMHPDVIALGARHHSAVDWFFGDSVSTNLATDRRWSLLIVP